MNEVKTFMVEYFPLTNMAIKKAMEMNNFPGGNYHVESYTIEIDDHSPIYAENFPGILKKFEHIMTMAKQGGVRFSRETVRERSYGQIIADEFHSRVEGRDESDSYPVSVRTSLTFEDYGEVPNLVILVFVYNRNFITESYHEKIANNLDIQFAEQLVRDIERMHELYVARKLYANDEKYISSFSGTAVEYMIQHNQIGTTGILGNTVSHAVLRAHPELIYPIFRLNDRVRFVFVDKRTTNFETLTKSIIDENIETFSNADDSTLIRFLLGDAKMVLGRYNYVYRDTNDRDSIPVCLIDCLGTSNEEISEISLMLRILNEYQFFEKPGITFKAVLTTDEDKKTHGIQLIDDAEDLETRLDHK